MEYDLEEAEIQGRSNSGREPGMYGGANRVKKEKAFRC